jgi:hypothetical protein
MTGNIRLIKSSLLRNFLTATSEFDCISGALGDLRFQNFPGELLQDPPNKLMPSVFAIAPLIQKWLWVPEHAVRSLKLRSSAFGCNSYSSQRNVYYELF